MRTKRSAAPFFMLYFFILLAIYLTWKIIHWFPISFPKATLMPSRLSVIYGAPGSGKTTLLAWYAKWYINSGIPVYSNVPIAGCMQITKNDLGTFAVENGLLLIDEAGLEYNNRDLSAFSKRSGESQQLDFYKRHRHYNTQIIIASQGFDDMDKKLRTLATDMYIVRRSLIPGCLVQRRIRKRPGIDPTTHKPDDLYDFQPFSAKRYWGRSVWHMFDSYDTDTLPAKLLHVYGEDDWIEVENYNLLHDYV